jgi:triosephosphate isomerase (TIM)
MRKKIVAGNWKMNKTFLESQALCTEVLALANTDVKNNAIIVLCVPFPFLVPVRNEVQGSRVQVGAQNCSEHEAGAYTGEVSAPMLSSIKIPFVIIGHSERRQYFGEDGKLLAKKVDVALKHNLTPIFCCGEPLVVREAGKHEQLVRQQVEESLFHLSADQIQKVVVAYEPVWAIGTGKTATSQQAQDMHAVIRKQVASKFGPAIANEISILYGGSVKADNAKELFACADVDGGLVGGASLKAREFVDIVNGVAP